MLLERGFLAYLFGFSIFEADCIEDEMCALIEEGTKRLDAGGFAFATEFCSCWNDKCRIGCFCELSVWIRVMACTYTPCALAFSAVQTT